MREIQRTIVGALLVSKDGKIFVVRPDPKNKGAYEDFWVIPGGGVEDGETPEQAVIRETLEETGIDISDCKIEFADDKKTGQSEKNLKPSGERVLVKMKFIEFRIILKDVAGNTPVTLSHEHSEYRWLDPDDLANYRLSPPSEQLVRQLGYLK
jgi:8-oxo-dGTP pyrophosphatase MutT (NUDIX family)